MRRLRAYLDPHARARRARAPRSWPPPPGAVRDILRRFWPDVRPYRRWIAVGLVFAVVVPAIETAEIWMFKLVVDEVLVPGDLGPAGLDRPDLPGALLLTGALVGFADDYIAAWVGERFIAAPAHAGLQPRAAPVGRGPRPAARRRPREPHVRRRGGDRVGRGRRRRRPALGGLPDPLLRGGAVLPRLAPRADRARHGAALLGDRARGSRAS